MPAFPPFSNASALVGQQYLDLTGAAPTTAQLNCAAVASLDGVRLGEASCWGCDAASTRTTDVDPVARLYLAYFLRAPDPGGLTYWIGQKRDGKSEYAISDYFASSSEFKATYGSLSNAAFVTLVYENVLDRAPDPGGDAYWVGQLDSATKTRGQVMVGFSESSEYKTLAQPEVDVAVTWDDMLAVTPGSSVLHTWIANLSTGGGTVADLAQAILATTAYLKRVT